MTEEFNLSNEREKLRKYLKEQFGEKSIIPDDILNLVIEKDRKFIRLLKEDLSWDNTRKPKSEVPLDEIYKTIDKFAGDKLI